jgi:hypothetical protein
VSTVEKGSLSRERRKKKEERTAKFTQVFISTTLKINPETRKKIVDLLPASSI